MRRRWGALAAIALLAVVGCSGDDSGDGGEDAQPATTAGDPPAVQPAPADVIAAIEDDGGGPDCDPSDPRACLLPFPSNRFTVESADTDTGLLVALPESGMPVNADGVVADPTEWNRNDGFSPGTALLTQVPGLDVEASDLPAITDIPDSLAEDSPVVVVDMDTGERQPVWAEQDSGAEADEDRLLFIRAGVNYLEGHHYAVGLRDLVGTDGEALEPSPGFLVYRDNLSTDLPVIEDHREPMERAIGALALAGVPRQDLYLAWDFTIASERNLSERLLHIRDDAFADLGAAAPEFTVDDVVVDPEEAELRYIHGTFQVPLYLTEDGAAGTRFDNGPDGLPQRNGDFTADFECAVPDAAADRPAPMSLYGHGLLGSRDEVEAGNIADFVREHGVAFCATDWIGMSEDDVANAASILGQLGEFPTLADRSQQGILNFLFLGRLMLHEDGLTSAVEFQNDAGDPLLDTSALAFDANSQGGIMGGAATAVAQDWTRAVLGVPGMNYSLLLRRSVDFDTYAAILDPAYPDPVEQNLGLSIVQMLWDRAENDGYAQHLTSDPYPDTPEHQVLLNVAFGDHQVSMWSAEIMARTIGASVRQPALAEGRHPDTEPLWGLEAVDEYPFAGSALVYWDSGAEVPPITNSPPHAGPDPHEDPRRPRQPRPEVRLPLGGRAHRRLRRLTLHSRGNGVVKPSRAPGAQQNGSCRAWREGCPGPTATCALSTRGSAA